MSIDGEMYANAMKFKEKSNELRVLIKNRDRKVCFVLTGIIISIILFIGTIIYLIGLGIIQLYSLEYFNDICTIGIIILYIICFVYLYKKAELWKTDVKKN